MGLLNETTKNDKNGANSANGTVGVNEDNALGETKNEVRSAATLQSLEELNLSPRAQAYFRRQNLPLEEVVWRGRTLYYLNQCGIICTRGKLMQEMIAKLNEAGFIRHDIVAKSFCLDRLERAVHRPKDSVPCDLEGFDVVETLDGLGQRCLETDFRVGNARYEAFQNPSKERVKEVERQLVRNLKERECAVILYRYGFRYDHCYSQGEISRLYHVSKEYIRQVEQRALTKLRWQEKRAQANRERQSNDGRLAGTTDIRCLELSARTCTGLMRNEVYQIADIIGWPADQWDRMRLMGVTNFREVERQMRLAGYEDFCIATS